MTEGAPSANPDANVLAQSHRLNLILVQRMPYDLEYLAPQEILQILRLCNTYGVDWTPGLEADAKNEARMFRVSRPVAAGIEWVSVRVRVRLEELVEDPDGVWVPDGGIVWGMQVLGQLQASIHEEIQAEMEG